MDRLLSIFLYALSKNQGSGINGIDAKITGIISFLDANYHRQISVKELSEMLGLTENYTGVYFYEQTGMHIKEYINQLRLFNALKLLKDSDMTVKEIAYHVGFHSPEYMTRLFQETYRISPKDYRKQFPKSPNTSLL